MTEKIASCSLCGRPIEDFGKYMLAKQVVGWHIWRKQGGINRLLGSRETGALAHAQCARDVQSGRFAQEALPLWKD